MSRYNSRHVVKYVTLHEKQVLGILEIIPNLAGLQDGILKFVHGKNTIRIIKVLHMQATKIKLMSTKTIHTVIY